METVSSVEDPDTFFAFFVPVYSDDNGSIAEVVVQFGMIRLSEWTIFVRLRNVSMDNQIFGFSPIESYSHTSSVYYLPKVALKM